MPRESAETLRIRRTVRLKSRRHVDDDEDDVLPTRTCRRPRKASEFVFGGDEDQWANEYYGEESEEDEEEEMESEDMIGIRWTDHADSGASPQLRSERISSLETYGSRLQKEREKQAAAREEEKKQQLRKLMGFETGAHGDESVKTVLSFEEEEKDLSSYDESSSDASTHLCLKTIDISDSQLELLNIFNDFPIPEDPGLVPAFWIINPPPASYKDDGIQKFNDLAKEMKLRPINSIKEMLQTDTLNLRYYGIDPRIMRAICEALRNNTSVQTIDLTENRLSVDACCWLNNLLMSNEIISCINLSGCRIGAEGAKKLEDGFAAASALLELDLSHCNLGDEGLLHVSTAIYHSNVLEYVNLSDNQLTDDSAEALKTMLTQTDTLKHLDLSWNSLYGREFAKTFFQSLSRNATLEYLNMSWNALAKDEAPLLAAHLAKSETLRELDLTGNRFTAIEAGQIGKVLMKNFSLEILRIGDNPLESTGAAALIKALLPEKSPGLQLQILDMKNVWANKDIISILDTLSRDRPSLNIRLGGILGNYKLRGPDPRKIFLRRANYEAMSSKKKKLRRDFGHFILTLENEAVPEAKFKESVKRFKLKLSESLIDEIMNAFAVPKGLVDQTSMKEFYLKEFPDTKPPSPKSETKKKKGGKTSKVKSPK